MEFSILQILQITIEGVEYDGEAPVINGIEDGMTYCNQVSFTVADDNLDNVKINENIVTPDINGVYIVNSAANAQTITVTDKAGNSISYTITVNDGHTLKKVPAKESTETAEGNIGYWYCEICGKYFKDENGQIEISKEQTVIPAKGKGTESAISPQTGDNSNIAFWIAVMLASGAVLTGTVLYNRKRKCSK